MSWGLRLRQWIAALRLAGVAKVPWLGLLRAILSGPVPRRVWRQRLRYGCFQCPLYSKVNGVMLCRSSHPDMLGIGCGCYLPFLAMAAAPYPKGCFGKTLADDIGWPLYQHPSVWARLLAPLRFLCGR